MQIKLLQLKNWPLLTIYLCSFRKGPENFWCQSDFKPCYLHEVNMIYLICFYQKKILEKFEENRLLSEKLFSLVVKFLVSPPMETLGVVSVLSETAHHIFLKIYMKLGFKKLGKMFKELFWSFSPFWLKTVQNLSFWPKMEGFLLLFFENLTSYFSILLEA